MIVILWHCASRLTHQSFCCSNIRYRKRVEDSQSSRATKSLRMYVFKDSLTAKPYGFFSDDTADLPIYNKDPSQVVFKSGGSE